METLSWKFTEACNYNKSNFASPCQRHLALASWNAFGWKDISWLTHGLKGSLSLGTVSGICVLCSTTLLVNTDNKKNVWCIIQIFALLLSLRMHIYIVYFKNCRQLTLTVDFHIRSLSTLSELTLLKQCISRKFCDSMLNDITIVLFM